MRRFPDYLWVIPLCLVLFGLSAYGAALRRETSIPRAAHQIAYCIPSSPWAQPGAIAFAPCRTDLVVDL